MIAYVLLAAVAASFAFTQWKAAQIESQFPNKGELTDVGGFNLNSLDIPPGPSPDLPPIVFVHGASGNLLDQAHTFRGPLEGRTRLLFVDRPGHGYSERGPLENDTPAGQADAIARLMEIKGIDKAIIVGHSFGGAIVASLALRHPEKVSGLVFLAAATHPWEGGVDWYYNLAATPVIGWLFTNTVALPAGLMRVDGGTRAVFAPNERPDDYVAATAPSLVLRPSIFRYNARDVSGLQAYVRQVAPQYSQIKAPTVVITGDADSVVYEEIHSIGLARDIAGAELVWIHGLGHKPDYSARSIAVAAIEKVAGYDRDLQAMIGDWRPE